MEVYVLEGYLPNEGTSDILGVYENPDVPMDQVQRLHPGILWTEYETYSVSDTIDAKIYYIQKHEVILDEIPIIRN